MRPPDVRWAISPHGGRCQAPYSAWPFESGFEEAAMVELRGFEPLTP